MPKHTAHLSACDAQKEAAMSRGLANALSVIRVPRGDAQPTEHDARAVLDRDRDTLHLPPEGTLRDIEIAGPYAITVDGVELDEYTVWER